MITFTYINIPFQVWDYHPIYLPEFLKIQVAENTPLSEPMYFYLDFASRQDEVSIEKREPMNHSMPLREVTCVKVRVNQEDTLSEVGDGLNQLDNIWILLSKENFIELEFDYGVSHQLKDFRPDLPLVISW